MLTKHIIIIFQLVRDDGVRANRRLAFSRSIRNHI